MSIDEQERQRLRELAGAVADESPIDWEAELRSNAHTQSKLRQLRLIESIATAYRSAPSGDTPRDTPADAASPPTAAPREQEPQGETEEPDLLSSITPTSTMATSAPPPIPRRWGGLEIRERLGGGSFGEVYRAHDVGLQQDVALKLLHSARKSTPAEDESFLKEARQLARVRHPNVLVVHGADRHDGRIGLWTDLVRGKTLEGELKQRGRYGGQEAALIGIDLCHALAAVHAEGLVHRDVKTANVMREEGGKIVLLDFSATTMRTVGRVEDAPGTISGTPLFMAPEAFTGVDSGCRADIYSLGVVIYRLVTGSYPIDARTLTELLERHGEFQHTPLMDLRPDLPGALVAVVEQAIHVDSERRFSSMGEMEQALAAAIGLPSPAPRLVSAPMPVPSKPSPTWRPFAWIAAAILLAAAVYYGWPSAPAFKVEASLHKSTDSGRVALEQGAQIEPQDQLFLELQGTQSMYVYVVSEDRAGHETVLFPLDGAATQNPLDADRLHELPGMVAGQRVFWEVTSADGSDSILVLASRERVTEIEEIFAQLRQAGDAPEEQGEDTDIAGQLRGIGGLIKARPSASDGATKIMRSARRDNVWIWEWLLANP